MIAFLVRACVVFAKRCVGLIVRPYETYRDISERSGYRELFIIGLFVSLYFFVASIVKIATFAPYVLTKWWILLLSATGSTFCLSVLLFWYVGRVFGSKGELKCVTLGWAYTLVPTLAWFWMTSILFVLLPPPRTESWKGILFSVVYLVVTLVLFFWKVTLGYLTLRFGLKLDLVKIIVVCVIVLPILGVHSVLMYAIGIFRIPFI
jgi:hypothetical protein